ncbi:hypothetical protein niasHT_016157 [Heterodera trifolii]|uniref:Transmembrane protein n=1 Tax=Heterodera trifolii TaxID=157864 RepID=A0ABD2KV30_9BILA
MFPFVPKKVQKMPKGGQRMPKALRFSQMVPFLTIASLVTASNAPTPSVQSVQFPQNFAAPPADSAAEWPFSEREMAQLAIQEVIQLQKEKRQKGAKERDAGQHKNTKIWPYSLYEQQMSKIFGERKRGTSEEEERLLKTHTPVVIHLPAYRGTAEARGGETSQRQNIKSAFERTELAQKAKPIRAQSNRWHGGEKEKGRNKVANRPRASSAEHSLITRPQSMFVPFHRPSQLRPIEPINSTQKAATEGTAANVHQTDHFCRCLRRRREWQKVGREKGNRSKGKSDRRNIWKKAFGKYAEGRGKVIRFYFGLFFDRYVFEPLRF